MRSRFDKQLDILNSNMIEMGALIDNAISKAALALRTQDLELAAEIVKRDDEIDNKERDIESLCMKILLQQQPVAGDFRLVSTALKMITDMERIGDHAADISEITEYLAGQEYISKLDNILQMSDSTIKMVSDSINAYVKKDLALARAVIEHDDIVDSLFLKVRNDLIEMIHKDPVHGEQAIDLLMIAKYFERIGDHAVNVAEWVEFSITGKHKNKQIF